LGTICGTASVGALAILGERRLIKAPDWISEGPPRGDLSVCAFHVAVHESAIGT